LLLDSYRSVNAAMESFFSLLQKNVLDTRRWETRKELRLAIVTWIETKYNRRRRTTSNATLRCQGRAVDLRNQWPEGQTPACEPPDLCRVL
jgi:transposase InsO family protein